MNYHKFLLRLPLSLFEKLNQVAKKNKRSITKEITIAIENYLDESSSEPKWIRQLQEKSDLVDQLREILKKD